MATRIESKEINEREYTVRQWSAEKSMLMKFKLIRALGSSFSVLIEKEVSSDEEKLSKAVSVLFDNNSPEELVSLIKSCIISGQISVKELDEEKAQTLTDVKFKQLFSGGDNLTEIYQLFAFILKVNYENFFKGLKGSGLIPNAVENL